MPRADETWRGRVAWVTGASSGIGAAVARKLSRHGLCLVLVARRRDRLEALADEVRRSAGSALPIAADLTLELERQRFVHQAMDAWGAPDVLVNNAGIGWYGYGDEMPRSVVRQMLQLNAEAVVDLSLAVLPAMRRRGRGHILNVGSIAGSLPSQGVALYSATKSFLDAFSSALHRELRGSGVRVSVVRPGPVQSEFYAAAARRLQGRPLPAERFAVRPEGVADCIWSLLRRPRRVAYVPRVLSLVPWLELSFGWLIDRLGPLLLRRPPSARVG